MDLATTNQRICFEGELIFCFEGNSKLGCEIHDPSRMLSREAGGGRRRTVSAYLLGSGDQCRGTHRADNRTERAASLRYSPTCKTTSQYHLMTTAVTQRPALIAHEQTSSRTLSSVRWRELGFGAAARLSPRESWRNLPETELAQAGKKRAARSTHQKRSSEVQAPKSRTNDLYTITVDSVRWSICPKKRTAHPYVVHVRACVCSVWIAASFRRAHISGGSSPQNR